MRIYDAAGNNRYRDHREIRTAELKFLAAEEELKAQQVLVSQAQLQFSAALEERSAARKDLITAIKRISEPGRIYVPGGSSERRPGQSIVLTIPSRNSGQKRLGAVPTIYGH